MKSHSEPAGLDHRESADGYSGIVCRLNDRWRVIVCKDALQWILQRRDGERRGRARWTGESYHRRRDALIRVCRTKAGEIDPAAAAILEGLSGTMGGAS
ncbi:hypothetical protein [Neoaquamicrobium sediminum]|uniref:hypothetical protein n=1 Tax=Neoaquamicrobium sediminum TaxID=1849104 RepID=UPI00360BD6D4